MEGALFSLRAVAIDLNAVEFLALAKKEGVCFDRVLMFGRQNLIAEPASLKGFFQEFDAPVAENIRALQRGPQPPFAEVVFNTLGAKEVSSLDASNYQDAEFVHDMNLPVPDSLKNRFDVVYDGGSLEHVFNVLAALKNCMQMVKPGGELIINTPANNWFGHGFYQFSPEFYFCALSEENGFQIKHVVAHRPISNSRWHEVVDPKMLGGDPGALRTLYPVLLMVQARKVRDVEIFARAPQQTLYETTWSMQSRKYKPGHMRMLMEKVMRVVPETLRYQFLRRHSFTSRRLFRPLQRPKLGSR
jgi:SAM-dependent methyltransferase